MPKTAPTRAAYDVATVTDLLAEKMSRDAMERRVRSGAWQRPARGVYVLHDRLLTPVDLGHVAAAYAGKDLVISGLVVLHELGLRWLPALHEVDGLVPDRVRRPDSKRVRLHRTTRHADLETWVRAGLRWADAERAVVDAGRLVPGLRDVRGIVLGAVADRHATVDGLRSILDAGQRNGSARVRRAVLDAERGCASPPEAELVDALLGCGEPFLVNPQIWHHGRLVGSPDIWMLNRAVGGEVESVERHGSADDVASTYERHERFADAKIELVHVPVRRIRAAADEAARHLLGRARRAAPGPPDLVVVPRGPVLR
ncbi:MAG: hypothetical protein JWP11_309 [Frankiales bacterium]|nr:hypothetical protein [Frankiales bacterium]